LINYTNGQPPDSMRRRWERMVALAKANPGRFVLCTTIDPRGAGSPDFAARTVAQLRRDILDGAELVKVWKDFGMGTRDEPGKFVQVDDPRFQPIWDFLAEHRIPVIAHLGDPAAAWQPIDSTSPHFWYYRDNPRYYAYEHPEMPSSATILAAQDAWLRRNPRLTVIGAHLASMAEDLDSLALRLDAFPNLSVDLAGRTKVLREQSKDRVRAWIVHYGGRVLYGSDMELDPVPAEKPAPEPGADAAFVHGRLLRDWEYLADTLRLPDSTLVQLMRGNAERVLAQADSARGRLLEAQVDLAHQPSVSR
jgi:predicted TIM-barrel fold metal-dependent hydrolase